MGTELLQQGLNWITLGCIYTLIAVGFSLLFGVLKVIHFSHGDVALVAPFIALATLQAMLGSLSGSSGGLILFVACAIAVLAIGLLGVFLDWLVIGRFRDAPPMMALVATVALGIVLRESVRHLFPNGSNPQPFPLLVETSVALPGVGTIPGFNILVITTSVTVIVLLFVLLQRTPAGIRIRAVSQDQQIARLMAINPRRVFRSTFFIASAIGGVGGLFYSSYAGVARFDFGIQAGLIGFSAAVVGGLGSMPGAIVGSILIAGLDTFVQAVVPNGAAFRLVFAFALVIVVLVFKPSGLLGRTLVEKV
ncbi:branched-chain amino acid ABC transporter permease [Mesorhizobium sp. AR07]|uniref:branched-chain amino acid ABC transporter permease n=1 Tax=Mesorhizobium sp. AR07 TaxID=2865838 RepID=UPI002160126F|nr:branched-chain amino acid ABC transporter permease [Mesorhizobium sp. AR07]UVK41842.1 branched-chain amino acid ABC transporter permease [Mesorhizobium sp. AR07]